MNFNPALYHYPSRRNVVFANRGMVATSTPQAAQAGLAVLRAGGNAIDAAIATAACLTVVEPCSNGLGSDAFALVWTGGKLHGLNASGTAPQKLTADMIRNQGHSEMPKYGWLTVNVPGAPAAWAELSEKFGRLSLTETLAPAVDYAREGFPVSLNMSILTRRAWELYQHKFKEAHLRRWFEHFGIEGRAPRAGEIWRSEDTARTLEAISATKAAAYYQGELLEKILDFSNKTGGYLCREDFEQYRPEWVEPITVNYRGYDVWEIPPNGHGISVLMTLNLLRGFELSANREEARNYHLQLEAMKLAYADTKQYVADPRTMQVGVEDLLSESYAAERRKLIGETALTPAPGTPPRGGTVYLATADNEGNMVSYIQSNYMGYGSGLVVPGTGIHLHNRGNNFNLAEGHVNCYAPGKRPYHTIIPGFLSKDGQPVGPFGVMGAFMQPQGQVQMVCNTVDFEFNPQDALDAPRWQWMTGREIQLEHNVPLHIMQDLRNRGHQVTVMEDRTDMGRGQIIWRLDNGVLCGGTEPRTDGSIAIY